MKCELTFKSLDSYNLERVYNWNYSFQISSFSEPHQKWTEEKIVLPNQDGLGRVNSVNAVNNR